MSDYESVCEHLREAEAENKRLVEEATRLRKALAKTYDSLERLGRELLREARGT